MRTGATRARPRWSRRCWSVRAPGSFSPIHHRCMASTSRPARGGQPDGETRTLAWLAVHRHAPLVPLDDPVDHREPQPGALLLGGEERVEDLLHELGRDARPVVLEDDLEAVLLWAGPGGHAQGPSLPHGLDGVDDDVDEG